ncbi:MAG: arsenate reductase ArsC [Chthoniobacterales bacterium]|nr:arsenate reductase ArsC [Chthoniobacterales bacterium]
MKNVLFICVHNSARSQMAAALLNRECPEEFHAESAGLEPGTLNPIVVESLQEIGIDISQNEPRAVCDVFKSNAKIFTYVVTVCSEAEAEGCPIFPGPATRLHWPFDDPSKFTGKHAERLRRTGEVREKIQARVKEFCAAQCALGANV